VLHAAQHSTAQHSTAQHSTAMKQNTAHRICVHSTHVMCHLLTEEGAERARSLHPVKQLRTLGSLLMPHFVRG